jgi:hypothetical protein
MKVRDLIEWLKAFEDQDADVLVVAHEAGREYYDQGGNAYETEFDPEKHSEYTDMRGNPYVPPGATYENKRTLLLGAMNG